MLSSGEANSKKVSRSFRTEMQADLVISSVWLPDRLCRETRRHESHRERRQLQIKAERVVDAIADARHSPVMLSKLVAVEAQIAEVDGRMEAESR